MSISPACLSGSEQIAGMTGDDCFGSSLESITLPDRTNKEQKEHVKNGAADLGDARSHRMAIRRVFLQECDFPALKAWGKGLS